MKNQAIIIFAVLISVFTAIFFLSANTPTKTEVPNYNSEIKYVPIGDSYTIGQGVNADESWPSLLTKRLQNEGIDIALIKNPAVSGYTTQNAIDHELSDLESANANFVTVLIGANDSFQGIDPDVFHKRLIVLLDRIQNLLPDKQKLLLITIPDYSITPAIKSNFPENIKETKELIIKYNQIIVEEAEARNLEFVDLFEISQKVRLDPGLIIDDGLHPSAKQYELWVEEIFPAAQKVLKRE